MNKKFVTLLLSAFLAAGAVCALSSCGEKNSNAEEPNKTEETVKTEETWISRELIAERETEICAIYSESKYSSHSVDSVVYFYGNYHNTYVACMGVGVTMAIETEIVDGVMFVYPCPVYIFAFRNGKIYTMQEAFDSNYLSHSDIEDIRTISIEQRFALEEAWDEI